MWDIWKPLWLLRSNIMHKLTWLCKISTENWTGKCCYADVFHKLTIFQWHLGWIRSCPTHPDDPGASSKWNWNYSGSVVKYKFSLASSKFSKKCPRLLIQWNTEIWFLNIFVCTLQFLSTVCYFSISCILLSAKVVFVPKRLLSKISI